MPNNDFSSPEENIKSDKQIIESPEVKAIAKKAVEKNKMEFGPAEIGYFLVYPNISRQKSCQVHENKSRDKILLLKRLSDRNIRRIMGYVR